MSRIEIDLDLIIFCKYYVDIPSSSVYYNFFGQPYYTPLFFAGIRDPGPEHMFKSIYNDGKGAKISNVIWGRAFRPYSSYCRDYDQALSQYDDMLLVASARNDGKIKIPADCKNTIGGMLFHYSFE